MADFLSSLATAAATPREITFRGATGTVYFRPLSAGQRASLLKGQRVSSQGDGTSVMEIDLGENERQKLMLVQFCVVTEDGKPRYPTLAAVEALPADLVQVLYAEASTFNAGEGEPGKP